jgi:hypothetical protein
MMTRWLRRIAGAYVQAMSDNSRRVTVGNSPFVKPSQELRQPQPVYRYQPPVHRTPHVDLPPDPITAFLGERPFCYCGKVWTDTPQGHAARDRHADLDLPQCSRAWRDRINARARQRRAAMKASPVLAEQLRDYEREQRQRQAARLQRVNRAQAS